MSRLYSIIGIGLSLLVVGVAAANSAATVSSGDAAFAAQCTMFVSPAPNTQCPQMTQACEAMYAGCILMGTKECTLSGPVKCASPPCINVNQAAIISNCT